MHESGSSWSAHTSLAEFGAAEVDHTLLWRLYLHHRPVLESEEYVDSVRFAHGWVALGPMNLSLACQSGFLDSGADHATLWARPLAATMLASPLAPTSEPTTFSPPPLAMRTQPWTIRSAHRTTSSTRMARNPSSDQHLIHPGCLERPCACLFAAVFVRLGPSVAHIPL